MLNDVNQGDEITAAKVAVRQSLSCRTLAAFE
jgi:hypothetical protein